MDNDNEEIYEGIKSDYEQFINDKIESIKELAGGLPDSVIIFIVKFKEGTPATTIFQMTRQMEEYLTRRIPKSIAIIPVIGANENNIEIILPHAPLDKFVELEGKFRYLEGRVLEVEKNF